MIRIYCELNNGDRVIATDAKDLRAFEAEFTDALLAFIEHEKDDLEYALSSLMPHVFQLAFKLQGYRCDSVREQRLLIAGYEAPHDENLIVATNDNTLPAEEQESEMVAAVRTLKAEGRSVREIAKALGIPRTNAHRLILRLRNSPSKEAHATEAQP